MIEFKNEKELKDYLLSWEKKSFTGWDFSGINRNMKEDDLPWNYKKELLQLLKKSDLLLDMGTGGGEFLLSLGHCYKNTTVTEGYKPNIEICNSILAPKGVRVIPLVGDALLPVEDESFDVVSNRHESFNVKELKRIIKKNGHFVTQQVGCENNMNLASYINPGYKSCNPNNYLDFVCNELIENGFEIIVSKEVYPKTYFYDLGTLVYYMKIIEWEFPGFNVETHFDKLRILKKELDEKKAIESIEHRFLIIARKK